MKYLSLEYIKQHSRIDYDCEDDLLEMYGDSAEIDSYVVSSRSKNVPFTLEELIEYDEYILCEEKTV